MKGHGKYFAVKHLRLSFECKSKIRFGFLNAKIMLVFQRPTFSFSLWRKSCTQKYEKLSKVFA